MLNFTFNGYAEFKELFGLRKHDNGTVSRKNQILLSYYRSREIYTWATREEKKYKYLNPKNMAQLKSLCLEIFEKEAYHRGDHIMFLNGMAWGNDLYETDNMKGKTVDGDEKAIRYVRVDNGRVFKMKAGKMYRHLILWTDFGKLLPLSVVNWLCEELALEWAGHNCQSQYELHVDEDFERIYSQRELLGNFGSCMVGQDQYYFYDNSVEAKAAYLTDENDLVVARAIIFENVRDEEDKKWRLLERQYSSDGDEVLKQILVNRLIEGGYIDGYKRVGADCHNAKAFVSNDGQDLSGKVFCIDCCLDDGDTLSYQDSFKWFNYGSQKAYNHSCVLYTDELNVTDSTYGGNRNYDEYHDQHTRNSLEDVYYNGEWMTCDCEELDDFVEVNGRYYHTDYITECAECGEPMVIGTRYDDSESYYSEITEEDYCCPICRDEAERLYCERHPDEYVWLDGEAVPVDEVGHCDCCDRDFRVDRWAPYSAITGKFYCCINCREADEKAYCEEHPDEYRWIDGVAVCVEDLSEEENENETLKITEDETL